MISFCECNRGPKGTASENVLIADLRPKPPCLRALSELLEELLDDDDEESEEDEEDEDDEEDGGVSPPPPPCLFFFFFLCLCFFFFFLSRRRALPKGLCTVFRHRRHRHHQMGHHLGVHLSFDEAPWTFSQT